MSQMSSLRGSIKRKFPQLVQAVWLGRLVKNQIKYPVVATVLDWPGKIAGGPFKGMRFPRSGGSSHYYEVLGVYEQCLAPLVEDIIRRQPKVIIDVGASWGYYALGFAYRCPTTKVIAYEMDASRADILRKFRWLNGLMERVEIQGECTVQRLREDLAQAPGALIFMDVEGAEDILLRPDHLAELRDAEIVVELHEMFAPGIGNRLKERFAATHILTIIPQTPSRQLERLDAPANRLLRFYWNSMTNEHRAEDMAWMHLVPNAAAKA